MYNPKLSAKTQESTVLSATYPYYVHTIYSIRYRIASHPTFYLLIDTSRLHRIELYVYHNYTTADDTMR